MKAKNVFDMCCNCFDMFIQFCPCNNNFRTVYTDSQPRPHSRKKNKVTTYNP